MRMVLAALGLSAVAGAAHAGPIHDSSEPSLHGGAASRPGSPVLTFHVDDTGVAVDADVLLPSSFGLTHRPTEELPSTVPPGFTHNVLNNGVMPVQTIPEPSVPALLALGLIGVGLGVRRRQQ